MKNVIKNSKKGILMVTMFAASLSFAKETSFFTIKNDVKKTALTLKNVKAGNLLSIIDDNGVILYKEIIQKTGIYSKGFDLTAFTDGAYLFELNKDLEIITIPFSVKSNTVIFNKEKGKTIFKPYFKVKEDVLYISKLTLNETPLTVAIYYVNSGESELKYSETVENTMDYKKAFKLTGLEEGSYKVIVTSEDRTYVKNI
ncbi:MAG: hypothetical protein HKO01_03530 [Flaviramulus sp.]|nr:hypothetical protein [Flaviramulus sp.]NNC49587.1 hypothetical protein [Flaviramulus sp.]